MRNVADHQLINIIMLFVTVRIRIKLRFVMAKSNNSYRDVNIVVIASNMSV